MSRRVGGVFVGVISSLMLATPAMAEPDEEVRVYAHPGEVDANVVLPVMAAPWPAGCLADVQVASGKAVMVNVAPKCAPFKSAIEEAILAGTFGTAAPAGTWVRLGGPAGKVPEQMWPVERVKVRLVDGPQPRVKGRRELPPDRCVVQVTAKAKAIVKTDILQCSAEATPEVERLVAALKLSGGPKMQVAQRIVVTGLSGVPVGDAVRSIWVIEGLPTPAHRVPLVYPKELLKGRNSNQEIVRICRFDLTINTIGGVKDAFFAQPRVGELCEEAFELSARAAFREWRFVPEVNDGKVTMGTYRMNVEFKVGN